MGWAGGDVILLTKQDRFSHQAWDLARDAFGSSLRIFDGTRDDPQPDLMALPPPAWLISFLSPWIIPKPVLDRCGEAINFHPGSVDYPGIGCYNFALYDEAPSYGAVCHIMLPKVDTGRVLEERIFPTASEDTVETLKLRTMETMMAMFEDMLARIVRGEPLPSSPTQWTRLPYTRKQMDALRIITADMSPHEIRRRVRAMTYPGYPGPVLEKPDGSCVRWPVPMRPPLA